MNEYVPKHSTYKQKRVLTVLDFLDYTIINPDNDSPIFYLEHLTTGDRTSVDQFEDSFDADYMQQGILPPNITMAIFDSVYDQLNPDKTFKKLNRTNKS